MKKGYEKPLVLFENFRASNALAGVCENPTDIFAQDVSF